MKLTIFGLTISSSWGNGHATLWRGLCNALARHGHEVVFFERNVPYYAGNRDLYEILGGRLHFYDDWDEIVPRACSQLNDADLAMVTSYCPDGPAAADLVLESRAGCKAFYDLDTPVTLERVQRNEMVPYLPESGLGRFDLVLSYTGGAALDALRTLLGARWVRPLYGSVDPQVHRPSQPAPQYRADLSYIGTYAEDRQQTLEELFVEPARRLSDRRFVIAGAQYPQGFPWTDNTFFVRHLPPCEHPAFYAASRLTLNVTRRAMMQMGYCPSGRLFEAAACGAPLLTDCWQGLEGFFEPGQEIAVAGNTNQALAALELTDAELARMGKAARDRTLTEHTADHRVGELESILREFHLARGTSHVGSDTGGRGGKQDATAGLLERALASGQSHDG